VKLLGVVPYCEKLSASQEAAELSFMGNLRRKAKVWESAFYNIANRLTGKRVLLFEGSDNQKRRSTYDGIVKRDAVQRRENEI
jgi:hypothetical protein